MTPALDTPLVTLNDTIYEAYDKIRELIPDNDREPFDEDMEEMSDEEADDEAEEYLEDNVIEYINNRVSPEGYFFGENEESGSIGFWKKEEEKKQQPTKEPSTEEPPTGLAEVLDEQGKIIAKSPYWVK